VRSLVWPPQLIVRFARARQPNRPYREWLPKIIDAWAVRKGIVFISTMTVGRTLQIARHKTDRMCPGWGRLSAVVRHQVSDAPPAFSDRRVRNRLSMNCSAIRDLPGLDPQLVDRLKKEFYRRLRFASSSRRWRRITVPNTRQDSWPTFFPMAPAAGQEKFKNLHFLRGGRSPNAHFDKIDPLDRVRVAVEINLRAFTRRYRTKYWRGP